MVSDFYQFNKGLLKSSPRGMKWFAYYSTRRFQRFKEYFWDQGDVFKVPFGNPVMNLKKYIKSAVVHNLDNTIHMR